MTGIIAIERPHSQIVNRQIIMLCVLSLRCPPNGSAIRRNLSIDINAKISIETSEDTMARIPATVQLQLFIHSIAISEYFCLYLKSYIAIIVR